MSKTGNIISRILILLLIGCASTHKFYYTPNYKLLLYATVNDSLDLYERDTTWLYSKVCLKLHVDSIDVNGILKFEKEQKRFYHNGNIFWNTQLFDTKMYDELKKVTITFFNARTTGRYEPEAVGAHSDCLTAEQRAYLTSISRSFKDRHSPTEKFSVYFDYILISNNFGRKNTYSGESNDILNYVVCHMKL